MTWAMGGLLGFDLETTGPDPTTALPVSFALSWWDFDIEQRSRYGLINPGVPIPPESTEIHGITDAMVADATRAGTLERSVTGIAGLIMSAVHDGFAVVGCNVVYDITIMDRLLREFGDPAGLYEDNWYGRVIDVLVMDRHIDPYRRGSRNLSALCNTYGVKLPNAHHAGGDARAAVGVARAIAAKSKEIASMDLDLLHVSQASWRRTWAKEFSEYRVKKGQEPLEESEGDWPVKGRKGVSL